MARMWRDNSGNPATVHKFKINTDEIYSLLCDYKTLFISVFSLDFVFLLYRFRFFPLDFVFLLYRFRFISLDFVFLLYGFRFISLDFVFLLYRFRWILFSFRFVSFRFSVYRYPIWNGNCLKMWKLGNLITPVSHTRFVDPLFENFAYFKKNHIFSLLKTVPYTRKYYFFRHCTKSTLIVWYFVSNKHYFIEQKRGKKKYVIFLVLGKLLKRWIPWWSACGLVPPLPSLKTKTVSSLNTTCL